MEQKENLKWLKTRSHEKSLENENRDWKIGRNGEIRDMYKDCDVVAHVRCIIVRLVWSCVRRRTMVPSIEVGIGETRGKETMRKIQIANGGIRRDQTGTSVETWRTHFGRSKSSRSINENANCIDWLISEDSPRDLTPLNTVNIIRKHITIKSVR